MRTPRASSPRLVTGFAVGLAAVTLSLTGCAPSSATAGAGSTAGSSDPNSIAIVASTNVYGDIANQIGGDKVTVTSIIDDPDKDPHEYQADAQNQLALSKASIVIENGGGYDDFVDTMLSSANNSSATVINAADVSGFDQKPADGAFNEHLWYDFPTVSKVVDRLASSLASVDPADAATFQANATNFKHKLSVLVASEAQLKATYSGTGVAITEPVPLYMLDAAGLVNKTPEKFSEAVENDTDVAPDVLNDTEALFSTGAARALVYNAQTTGPQTEAVLAAAKAAGVPEVAVTETLPAGQTYLEWMTANVAALKTALAASPTPTQ